MVRVRNTDMPVANAAVLPPQWDEKRPRPGDPLILFALATATDFHPSIAKEILQDIVRNF